MSGGRKNDGDRTAAARRSASPVGAAAIEAPADARLTVVTFTHGNNGEIQGLFDAHTG